MKNQVYVPAEVLPEHNKEYVRNYLEITKESGRLMMFAGDQKIEHLNDDFYGKDIPKEDADPIHLFNIASQAKIGVFTAQIGLISRYGNDFKNVPYLVKLNSKSSLVPTVQKDPVSALLTSVEQVLALKKASKLMILGIGLTVYTGSEFEEQMFQQAAQQIFKAHQYGLVAVVWSYPRGKAVLNEKDAHLIAGAAGVASCLGADFVKVNYPQAADPINSLKEAVMAAGRTKLVCAGGSSMREADFLKLLHKQIHIAGTSGNATGRNIHQKPLKEAIKFTNAIYGITVENKSAEQAFMAYKN